MIFRKQSPLGFFRLDLGETRTGSLLAYIASCLTDDGRGYYRVGMIGYGMLFSATHKASIRREVISTDESRPLVEDMLPMMGICMVRLGQPTVVQFPVKYLKEWIAMHNVLRRQTKE